MIRALRCSVAVVLACFAARAGDTVPFEAFGREFLKAHGAASAAELSPTALLERHHVRGTLGCFDVAYPSSFLADKDRALEFQRQCAALLGLQRAWIDFLAPGDARTASALADLAALEAWVKGWKPAALAQLAKSDDQRIGQLPGTDDALRGALERLSAFLAKPDVLGVAPREQKRVSLVFAPTRRQFVELAGYTGLVDAAQQAIVWTEATAGWTSFWMEWNLVLALQYPAWSEDPEFKGGTPMNEFEVSGAEQHTLQNAANALQWLCYGNDDALWMHQAVSMNLTLRALGELNALEGDTSRGTTGAKTEPYEKFVPGGNPKGGWLPPMPAAPQNTIKDGRWRAGKARDHGLAVLKKFQKEGAKELGKKKPAELSKELLRDTEAHFLLLAPDGVEKGLATAPFLGRAANLKPYPPPQFLVDYREFFRIYKCAFYDWLQRLGDRGNKDSSPARFAELLKALAARGLDANTDPAGFEALVQKTYGAPLSAADGTTDSLEWRFLAWLSKGR